MDIRGANNKVSRCLGIYWKKFTSIAKVTLFGLPGFARTSDVAWGHAVFQVLLE